MILSFHPCFEADAQIVLADRDLASADMEKIEQADALILPQSCGTELYYVCSRSKAKIFPEYGVRFAYPGKRGQCNLFRSFGLPHPKTFCWSSVKEFTQVCTSLREIPHSRPFLIKADMGHESEGIFLVENNKELQEALDYLSQREGFGFPGFVTQDLVYSKGNVLRVALIGDHILTYWKRPRSLGDPITSLNRGAFIDHQWRPDLQEEGKAEALRLARMTSLNLAAVDFVFSFLEKDPVPLFLEINYYFGRRGLGGTLRYYQLLYHAIRRWLKTNGLDPYVLRLI